MRDQIIKLQNLQVPPLMVCGGELVSHADIQGIQQARYRIIYGHPEAFLSQKLNQYQIS